MGEAKEYFHKIQNTFEQIGYLVVADVLNASYFGVPIKLVKDVSLLM